MNAIHSLVMMRLSFFNNRGKDLPDGLNHINSSTGFIKRWYKNHVLHREDGPALIMKDNSLDLQCWVINGVLYRKNGPAVENFSEDFFAWHDDRGVFYKFQKNNVLHWHLDGKDFDTEEAWIMAQALE